MRNREGAVWLEIVALAHCLVTRCGVPRLSGLTTKLDDEIGDEAPGRISAEKWKRHACPAFPLAESEVVHKRHKLNLPRKGDRGIVCLSPRWSPRWKESRLATSDDSYSNRIETRLEDTQRSPGCGLTQR